MITWEKFCALFRAKDEAPVPPFEPRIVTWQPKAYDLMNIYGRDERAHLNRWPRQFGPVPRLYRLWSEQRGWCWACGSAHASSRPDGPRTFKRWASGATPAEAYEKWRKT